MAEAQLVVFGFPASTRDLGHREPIPRVLMRGKDDGGFKCKAVEVRLDVWQVLKGSANVDRQVAFQTYQIEGIQRVAREPAIFFLERDQDVWRPLTDFDRNRINLPGFPRRTLVEPNNDLSPNAQKLALLLVNGILNPRNANDWKGFPAAFDDLSRLLGNIAWKTGLLDDHPYLIVQRLVQLAGSSNVQVAAHARKQVLEATGICSEIEAPYNAQVRQLEYQNFVHGRLPVRLPAESANELLHAYWVLKSFSCSEVPAVRVRAFSLLRRYYPGLDIVGCEICSQK